VDDKTWCNVINGHFVIIGLAVEDPEFVFFECLREEKDVVKGVLRDYFRLDMDVTKLYSEWEGRDIVFKKLSKPTGGIRVLRVDPWECLLSFICSQNNSIVRILKMVSALRQLFGELLFVLDCGEGKSVNLYSFPGPEAFLVDGDVESRLRENGFGYRAKYFVPVAQQIQTVDTLFSLRHQSYETVTDYLQTLPGVGPKVADCVALYSLDQLGAVPIDTHILKVALSHYVVGAGWREKSMTPGMYRKISGRLREALGEYAGWAQAVLFIGQLNVVK
jgi:N-glycosylase/DNA lyase